jgi:hypothetical protein
MDSQLDLHDQRGTVQSGTRNGACSRQAGVAPTSVVTHSRSRQPTARPSTLTTPTACPVNPGHLTGCPPFRPSVPEQQLTVKEI